MQWIAVGGGIEIAHLRSGIGVSGVDVLDVGSHYVWDCEGWTDVLLWSAVMKEVGCRK